MAAVGDGSTIERQAHPVDREPVAPAILETRVEQLAQTLGNAELDTARGFQGAQRRGLDNQGIGHGNPPTG